MTTSPKTKIFNAEVKRRCKGRRYNKQGTIFMNATSKKYWLGFMIAALSLLLPAPARLHVFAEDQNSLTSGKVAQIVGATSRVTEIETADFDQDGQKECLVLNQARGEITDCHGKVLWSSPDDWQVQQIQVGDLNRDGLPEAVLLVWRPFRPWPIDAFLPAGGRIEEFHDRDQRSCHVILIGWTHGGYNELWAGSALIQPVTQLRLVDLNGDGQQEMVALEEDYDHPERGGFLTVWRWNGFGFSLAGQDRHRYFQVQVIHSNSQEWIVAQN